LLDIVWKDYKQKNRTMILAIQNECLSLLRELAFSISPVAEWLSGYSDFIGFLFTLMKQKSTFDNAVGLVEEILASKDIYDLHLIPSFDTLVLSFSTRQLAFFCRVLALVIFLPDQLHIEHSNVLKSFELLNLKKSSRNLDIKKLIDKNHETLLCVPNLLERLVKLLYVQNYPSKTWADHISQFSNTADLLALLIGFEDSDDDWDEPIQHSDIDLKNPTQSFSLKSLTLATHQVEILFVICTLLGGTFKSQVQERLTHLSIIPKMDSFFEKINWEPNENEQRFERTHGPKCECNPESALKIQYLRLILNYCDSKIKDTKILLFSNSEVALIDQLLLSENRHEEKFNIIEDYLLSSDHTRSGLLFKLIGTLLKQPFDSNFRFWLASCVETFLRTSDSIYQYFVAKSGLLKYLINEVLTQGYKHEGSLQTNFDLLGELIKFNKDVFILFNKILSQLQHKKFFDIITIHLVDSNMFLRYMMISIEKFHEDNMVRKIISIIVMSLISQD